MRISRKKSFNFLFSMRNCEIHEKTGKHRETEKKKEKMNTFMLLLFTIFSMLLILCSKHSSQQVDVCIKIW